MKLHFTKHDSLYKIFKTVKKIPSYKTVTLFIDPQHIFFENERRGKQLKEIIDQQELTVTCVATTHFSQTYFQQLWLQVQFQYTYARQKRKQNILQFIFTSKKAHQHLIFKNNYLSYLIVISEVLVIWAILYFFRWLISPNASVTINPAKHIEQIVYNFEYFPSTQEEEFTEHLSVPYYTWTIPFEHRMTINVQNISYDIQHAQWEVQIKNTLDEDISLLNETKLISPEWLLFKINSPLNIPAGSIDKPWIVYASVTALPFTEKWEQIWSLWNISKWTQLLIKNLPESNLTRQITAQATKDFVNWSTSATGTVLAEDINIIEGRIIDYMEDQLKEKLKEEVNDPSLHILPFDDFQQLNIEEFVTTSHIGDATSFIEGKVSAKISYRYVLREELLEAIDRYLLQRPSEHFSLLDYDLHSLTFFDIHKSEYDSHYLIPTKLNIVRGYNFEQDLNKLIPEMKAKISAKSTDTARWLLLEYDEIENIDISISPPWYDTLPQVPSRIKFRLY